MNVEIPKVSVIMSCYCAEKTIGQAIESILHQTFIDFEFIIIDDGSLDQTGDIISAYAKKDERIVYFQNNSNLNLATSLNIGIREAKSPIIARMDADDVCLPNRLDTQYNFLTKNSNIDIVGSNAVFVVQGAAKGISNVPCQNEDIRSSRYSETSIIHPTVMVRKNAFEKFGYYDEKLAWAEDKDLWLRWTDKAVFANLKEPLLHYTVKPGMTLHKIYFNHYVMLLNMVRRKELLKNFHFFVKSLLSHIVKMLKN